MFKKNGLPNLDGATKAELRGIQHTAESQGDEAIADFFFGETSPEAIKAASAVASYAAFLLTARKCRANGDINKAMTLEGMCEKLYKELPEEVRW